MDNENHGVVNNSPQPPGYLVSIPPDTTSEKVSADPAYLGLSMPNLASWTGLALQIAWLEGCFNHNPKRPWRDTTRLSCLWHLQRLELSFGITPPPPNTQFCVLDTQWRIERLKNRWQPRSANLELVLAPTAVLKDAESIALGLCAVSDFELDVHGGNDASLIGRLATGLAYASGSHRVKLPLDGVINLPNGTASAATDSLDLLGRWLQAIQVKSWSSPPMGVAMGIRQLGGPLAAPGGMGGPFSPPGCAAPARRVFSSSSSSSSSSCASSTTMELSRSRRFFRAVTCGLI